MRINSHMVRRSLRALLIVFSGLPLTSCFTGIEGTETIELSRSDRRLVAVTAEDTFLNPVAATPLADWKPGKRFMVADDRVSLLMDPSLSDSGVAEIPLKDKIINFRGYSWRNRPDGSKEAMVMLGTADGKRIAFPTGKNAESASRDLRSDGLPMLIDMDMIAKASDLLVGKRLWTKSPIWYDSAGNRISGRKYIPVKVEKVDPGTLVFPVRLEITDDRGTKAYMLMNFGNTATDSRSFANLFSLSDIRKGYPAIEDDVWKLICDGNVKTGMTKEECRLALGNPIDVKSGHDYNRLLDIWQYDDGCYLQFADGILFNFRLLK